MTATLLLSNAVCSVLFFALIHTVEGAMDAVLLSVLGLSLLFFIVAVFNMFYRLTLRIASSIASGCSMLTRGSQELVHLDSNSSSDDENEETSNKAYCAYLPERIQKSTSTHTAITTASLSNSIDSVDIIIDGALAA